MEESTQEFSEIFRMWIAERGLTSLAPKMLFSRPWGYDIYLFDDCIGSFYSINHHKYEFRLSNDAAQAYDNWKFGDNKIPSFIGSVYDQATLKDICDAIDRVIARVGEKKIIAEEIQDCLKSHHYDVSIASKGIFFPNATIDINVSWRGDTLGYMTYDDGRFTSSHHYSWYRDHTRFKYVIYEPSEECLTLSGRLTDADKCSLLNLFCARAWAALNRRTGPNYRNYCPYCNSELYISSDGDIVASLDDIEDD